MPNNTDGPTPYDDVFRTMTYKGGSLVIPLVNLLFHLNLPVTAKVDHMADEQYATFQNGKQVKTIADAIIHIDGKPYHLECQAYDDNTIVIRIVRYDLEEAMLEAHFENNEYIVTVPFSGILCLRRPKDSPETWTVRIRTGETDGIYHIRAIYLDDFTLDDMFNKNLLFLLPFIAFNVEKEPKDKIFSIYNTLLQKLATMREENQVNDKQYDLITDMLKKVTRNVIKGETGKELEKLMGGQVLELPSERAYKQGLNEGKSKWLHEGEKKGFLDTLISLVNKKQLDTEIAVENAEAEGITRNEFMKLLKKSNSAQN